MPFPKNQIAAAMKTTPSLSEALSTHEATACSTPPTGRATRHAYFNALCALVSPV
mgnify:CR=1 FL=1